MLLSRKRKNQAPFILGGGGKKTVLSLKGAFVLSREAPRLKKRIFGNLGGGPIGALPGNWEGGETHMQNNLSEEKGTNPHVIRGRGARITGRKKRHLRGGVNNLWKEKIGAWVS